MPNLKVTWALFTGPAAQIDALFSGNVDVVAVGSNALITLWARTKGTPLEVKGVSAMSSMPIALNTRNPNVKSIKDFTDKDRIAVPSVQVSHQALLLQMAAAKEWGFENHKTAPSRRSNRRLHGEQEPGETHERQGTEERQGEIHPDGRRTRPI